MIELKKEQLDAINHEDGNLLVSASAGSGKTFVMISRLIRLVKEKKADVNEILAMTYTESAATDMKEKLKKALVKEIMDTGDEYLLTQCKKVATADISTIHAFCARLVRIYFHVAGVSHDFGILEGATAERLKAEAVNKTFRYFYGKDDQIFKKIAKRHAYKRADKDFKKSIISLYEFFNTEADPDELLDKFSNMYSTDGLNRFKKELVSFFSNAVSDLQDDAFDLELSLDSLEKPKLYAFVKQVCASVYECIAVKDYNDLLKIKSIKINASTETKLDDLDTEIKEKAKYLRDRLAEIIADYTAEVFDDDTMEEQRQNLKEHVDCLICAVRKFREIYAQLKREENLLDFDDLQHFALKALEDQEVATAVKNKYKYIFVDEYQDVNGVQEKLINMIAKNNVFMVGDVKQSIYGFRGCRSDFFLDKFNEMSKNEGETALLNHSFRSAQKVIDTVNEIFSFCMTGKEFGLDYEKTSKLVAGGVYKDGYSGRAQFHMLWKPVAEPKKEEEPRVYNLMDEIKPKEKTVSKLSSLITKIITDETLNKYYDPKTEEERFITYKDIAILVRKNKDTTTKDVVSGLKQHGIPVIAEASENILDYPEISTVTAVIRLIDCYYDDVALATVLKSPIGGFSDEELMDIACHFRNSIDEYKNFADAFFHSVEDGNSPLYKKAKDFDAYFEKIRRLADFLPIADVLEKVIADKCLEAFCFAESDGENKVKRLRKFLSFCRQGGKNCTAKEILRIIDDSDKGIPFLPVEESNAVTVMTIHASKGLEFPVVIVCGLEKDFGIRHESDEFLSDRDEGVAIKLYGDDRKKRETVWRKVFKKRMRVFTRREEMRILYVALTRATYSLHMVAEVKTDSRKSVFKDAKTYLDCIPETMPATMHEYGDFDFTEVSRGTRKVVIQDPDDKITSGLKKNFSYEYPFQADTSLPLKSSVTASLSSTDEPIRVVFDEYDGETDAEKGIIAHKFMENADLNSSSVEDQAEKMITSGVIGRNELDKIDLTRLKKVFESGMLKTNDGATVLREKSFLVSVPASMLYDVNSNTEILLQGVIDLLILDGNKAKIIDYKYSSKSPESLKKKYKKQLDLYAFAVEKVLGAKVEDKAIISLLSGEVIKID